MAWVGPAMKLGGAVFGGLMGLRKDPMQELAKRSMANQLDRAETMWPQATGALSKASGYFSPIAGGSRSAALEAMAPEIKGATERLDAGRSSLLSLAPRSGGSAAMLNPYAKADTATNMLMQARPGAAGQMMDIGKTWGAWAGQNQAAAPSLFNAARQSAQDRSALGASFFDTLAKNVPDLLSGIKGGGKKKSSGQGAGPYSL